MPRAFGPPGAGGLGGVGAGVGAGAGSLSAGTGAEAVSFRNVEYLKEATTSVACT